jgi:hypothetical protein
MYPKALNDRFAATLKQLLARVTKLESRTAAIDSGFPLACLPAVISSSYTSGNPMVYINGSTTLTGPYAYLTTYTPTASAAVYVLPVGAQQTYIILGATV